MLCMWVRQSVRLASPASPASVLDFSVEPSQAWSWCAPFSGNSEIMWEQSLAFPSSWSVPKTCITVILEGVLSEKAMAPHSSTLAWKIPWMEEPGRLQSMGSLRVGYDWATSLSLFTFMHWRRKWQPTPVFLPGESQGRGSLVGCRLWGRTESDMTEET